MNQQNTNGNAITFSGLVTFIVACLWIYIHFFQVNNVSKEVMQTEIQIKLNQSMNGQCNNVTLVQENDHLYDGIATFNDKSTVGITVKVDTDNYIWSVK